MSRKEKRFSGHTVDVFFECLIETAISIEKTSTNLAILDEWISCLDQLRDIQQFSLKQVYNLLIVYEKINSRLKACDNKAVVVEKKLRSMLDMITRCIQQLKQYPDKNRLSLGILETMLKKINNIDDKESPEFSQKLKEIENFVKKIIHEELSIYDFPKKKSLTPPEYFSDDLFPSDCSFEEIDSEVSDVKEKIGSPIHLWPRKASDRRDSFLKKINVYIKMISTHDKDDKCAEIFTENLGYLKDAFQSSNDCKLLTEEDLSAIKSKLEAIVFEICSTKKINMFGRSISGQYYTGAIELNKILSRIGDMIYNKNLTNVTTNKGSKEGASLKL